MFLNQEDQMKLICTIEDEISALGDYLYPDKDAYVNASIERIELALSMLKNSYLDPNTYIELRDRETGEIEYRYFEKGDIGALCYKASQLYAWADCDDTYEVVGVMCDGEALYYKGWQPNMLFEFYDCNGTIVYSANFPQWDH
jgi:hypothetical protein